jgi:hypothetical protein
MKLQSITLQDLTNLSAYAPELAPVCQEVIAHSKVSVPTDTVYSKGRPSFALLKVKAALESKAAPETPVTRLVQQDDGSFHGTFAGVLDGTNESKEV